MQNILIDALGTPVLPTPAYSPAKVDQETLTWPQDRFLLGWCPWYGFGKGAQVESHLLLMVNGQIVLMAGPHKEGSPMMYDSCRPFCFPAGAGVFVKAGSPVTIQFLVSNTDDWSTGGQANVRIYSVLA